MMNENRIKIAVNGGVGFGAKLNAKQLITLAKYLGEEEELELTVFQQLYIEVEEHQLEETVKDLEGVGLKCYPVGNFVKSLRTCNFCKGAVQEGMPTATKLNELIAGKPVPFTLRVAYTGCPVACGEPLINDIGVIKRKDTFELYLGGKAKGIDAKTGHLFNDGLTEQVLLDSVQKVISIYEINGKKRETFSKFINRYGIDNLKKQIVSED
ncbi:nitrite reductase [Peribacillus frigoritolerans]|uniref:nitrite reductase n=1 Tax=Peribacillus frigoritolerans TaxID=450367 RepID=UPI0007BFB3DE|nr:nitrite reductase [Peribacillus frigoritolerans]USK67031.1 nitrite reductase [Peribacillus frigoritolerans]